MPYISLETLYHCLPCQVYVLILLFLMYDPNTPMNCEGNLNWNQHSE